MATDPPRPDGEPATGSSAARWRRVEEVFASAVELEGEARNRAIDQGCGDDRELRAEVEALLEADARGGDFVERAVAGALDEHLAPPPADPLAGRARIGKYEILERVGAGGFGVVYRGRDRVLKRLVAIKICTSADEELRRRFVREAEIAARLQHPNVTTVHDLGVEDGIPYLVQEFLGGEDLDELIARREALPFTARLAVLEQAARGLAYAHSRGVLHRDVKPANLRLLAGGRVKLMDFGIARLLDEEVRLTADGQALGTAGYLAPEQLEGKAADHRADVFAFGVLAYELLAYRRPFDGASFGRISYRVVHEQPPRLSTVAPECPRWLEELVHRCLEKSPERRPQSFDEIVAALDRGELATAPTRQVETVPLPKTGEPPRSRLRARVVAAALLAIFLFLPLLWQVVDRLARPQAVAATGAEPGGDVLAATERSTPPSTEPGVEEHEALTAAPRSVDDRETPPRDRERGEPIGDDGERSSARLDLAAGDEPAAGGLEPDGARGQPLSGGFGAAGARHELDPGEPDAADASEEPSAGLDPVDALRLARLNPDPPRRAAGGGTAPAESGPPSEPASEPAPDAREEPLVVPMRPGEPIAGNEPGVEPPALLERPAPRYPPRARRLGREARVVVAVLVDESGAVAHALVKQSAGRGLGFDRAALEAARRARFRPARRDGVAGTMWTELEFDFRLDPR